MLTWISPQDPPHAFPPDSQALDDPPGLLAAGGDLSPDRLLAAYARGIFPWYSPGQPILWWTPDPREVLLPAKFHCSRSLRRALRVRGFETRRDTAFDATVAACAAPRSASSGTWITPPMRAAYNRLHALGVAHSYEIWRETRLVGGLYGVRMGAVFCGESMFSRERDASKAAMAALVADCQAQHIELIDCQLPSAHLRSLGSQGMPRRQFQRYLTPDSG